jgi:hypothetical protein
VHIARSTEIDFKASAPSSKSKYEPDASFRHKDARYPSVIIEVAYSQKKKRLSRLADNYLLDSDANVQVVVCLDIEYGKDSRKAMLSLWRPQLFDTPDGPELRAVDVVADEVGPVLENLTHRQCSDVPTRLSVTMKETLLIFLAYNSVSATSPARNLHGRRLETRIQTFAFLEHSSADTLML